MSEISDKVRERVRRGARWLDAHDPGWWAENAPPRVGCENSRPIDLHALNMSFVDTCVLGQRFGNFERVVHNVENPDAEGGVRWAEAHGFSTAVSISGIRFSDLTAAWKAYITHRRQTNALSEARAAVQPAERSTREVIDRLAREVSAESERVRQAFSTLADALADARASHVVSGTPLAPTDLLGPTEAAHYLGRTRQTISTWATHRRHDFPRPIAQLAATSIFDRRVLRAWAYSHTELVGTQALYWDEAL